MGLNNSCIKSAFETGEKSMVFALCLFLAVSIAVVYGQTLTFDFVDFDDQMYVTDSPKVPEGLTLDGIKWAFTTSHGGYPCPLTWLSFMLDRQLFGLLPWGFHLTNVILHIFNTVLLFLILRRYSHKLWQSFFVAAFFGLHPLHVESVAWITERKDVLSTLFMLLAMLVYAAYVERPAVGKYILVCATYSLGLMAKPMLVTFPFVLLIMDYWPLERLWPGATKMENNPMSKTGVPFYLLVLEKIPLIALSAILGIITFISQKSMGAMRYYSLSYRIGNAMVSYGSYILKMFKPVSLTVFYYHPDEGHADWKVIACITILLLITALTLLFRRRRYLLAGWLWYLLTLVPVIGFIQVGGQAMADRYTYIPLTGLFIMLVWLVGDITGRLHFRILLIGFGVSLLLSVISILTFKQVRCWRDTFTLFTHATKVSADSLIAHRALGVYFAEKGDAEGAMREFEIALKINPKDIDTLYNLGEFFAVKGEADEAIEYYKQVLELKPDHLNSYCALALITAEKGDFEKAIELYHEGLDNYPESAELHGGLGSVLLNMGKIDEAIKELKIGAGLKADSEIYGNLGLAMFYAGDSAEAEKYLTKAIWIDPANAQARYNLGNIYLAAGMLDKAIIEYTAAIEAKPGYIEAYGNLAIVFANKGDINQAIEYFDKTSKLDPNNSKAHFNLATALTRKGFIDKAIEHMQKAVELSPNNITARNGLADLLIQKGETEQAKSQYEKVLKIDPNNKDAQLGLLKINKN